MAAHIRPDIPQDRVALARDLIRKYGRLKVSYVATPHGVGANVLLHVCFVGKFKATTMANYLCGWPVLPYSVDITTRARNWTSREGRTYPTSGVRPMVRLTWQAHDALRLLTMVGWKVGKPSLDARLTAWRRWLDYRRASGAYVEPGS